MKKQFRYLVFHGDLDFIHNMPTAKFKSMKKAIAFIESQPDAEFWCFDKVEA